MGFDEQELNTGIADLYDDDSASDYNEDSEEADIDNFLSMEAESIQPAPIPQDIGNISNISDQVVPPMAAAPLPDFMSNPPAPNAPIPTAAPIPCGAPAPSARRLSGALEFVPSSSQSHGSHLPHHFPTPMSSNGLNGSAPIPEPPKSANPPKRGASLFGSLFGSSNNDDDGGDLSFDEEEVYRGGNYRSPS